MIKVTTEFFIGMSLLVLTASSGGILEFRDTATHFNAVGDAALTSEFFYKDFVAGVVPKSKTDIKFESQMGDAIPTTTDFQSSLTTEKAYYSRFSSDVSQELLINGQEQKTRTITADTYIIMPKKFDSTQSFNVQFSDNEDTQAEIKTVFTYDDVKYEFIKKLDPLNGDKLILFLQPYCPEFEDLGLDYEDDYRDSICINGLEYEGNLNIKAIKI